MNAKRLMAGGALPVLFAALLFVCGCGPAPAPARHGASGDGPFEVFVSIPPLAALAGALGGDQVHVTTLLAPGEGPHTFSTTPKQVMALGGASAYFHVGGFPFELELAKRIEANFPSLVIQDLADGLARIADTSHEHGEDAAGHAHADDMDPHVWMSPVMLKAMAATIAETFLRLDPAHADDYAQNLAATQGELDALDHHLREQLAPFTGRTFYIYHPALGYFAETYGLRQKSVEMDGKKPTPRQLQELIEQAQADGVHTIFVQPQFDQRSAQSVADAIQGTVVALDPLREEVLDNLRAIGDALAHALRAEPAP
ncbi:MAG: metal ABC transporter solute-binding protein, Zn/Mn family [Candidatus Hydrogenedentales bacterium]|jgi:zinc transport system substrate-binding protein